MSDIAERSAPSVDIGRRAAQRAETRMLIDGELRAAVSGAEFDNVSPATGLVLGTTAAAGAEDMDARHRRGPARVRRDRLVHQPRTAASAAWSSCSRLWRAEKRRPA